MPQCARCGKTVKIFFGSWKYKDYFPEFYDKPLCHSCSNKLDNERDLKKADSAKRKDIEAFCEHLRRIGLYTTTESTDCEAWDFIGSVRVAKRNIDVVELWRWFELHGDESSPTVMFECRFVVQTKVEGLENKLKAEGKRVTKGFLIKQVVDFIWKGEELARNLDSDAGLKSLILSQPKPTSIAIVPFKEQQCVKISMKWPRKALNIVYWYNWAKYCRKFVSEAFPSIEAFEVYDRIAQHIRNIANARL